MILTSIYRAKFVSKNSSCLGRNDYERDHIFCKNDFFW